MRATLPLLFLLGACAPQEDAPSWQLSSSGEGDQTGYGSDYDVIITPDGHSHVVTGRGEGCVVIEDQCYDVGAAQGRYCDDPDAQADIAFGPDGEVAQVVCYPAPSSASAVDDLLVREDGSATLPQTSNGAVVTFGAETDYTPIAGDLTLNAERITLFGNGRYVTTLQGDLTLASNNARVRGLSVEGDIIVASNANNSALAFASVGQDLRVEGNGFIALEVIVFGDLILAGNNAQLTAVGVQGAFEAPAQLPCTGCYSFSDADADQRVSADERTGQLPATH